jgi:hypothetical protein
MPAPTKFLKVIIILGGVAIKELPETVYIINKPKGKSCPPDYTCGNSSKSCSMKDEK